MIDLESVLRRADDLRFRHVPPETVVVRLEVPETMVLSELAGRILELVDGRRKVREILATILGEFAVERDQAYADLLRFLAELQSCGAIVDVEPGPNP